MQGERSTLYEFVSEAKEHLADVTDDLLALEKQQGEALRYRIDRLFRSVHSVKGGAGFFGRRTIEELAHGMETVLGEMRTGRLTSNAAVLEALLAGTDRLYALLDDAERSNEADVTAIVGRLRSLLAKEPADAATQRTDLAKGALTVIAPAPKEPFRYRLKIDLVESYRVQGRSPVVLVKELLARGTLADAQLQVSFEDLRSGLPEGPLLYEAIYATDCAPEQLQQALGLHAGQFTLIQSPLPAAKLTPMESVPTRPVVPAGKPADHAAPVPQSVRIGVQLLDRLMTLAGELVLVRNRAVQEVATEDTPMRRIVQRLDSVTSELQETVMLTRMQPVDTLFGKFPRLVRDLAKQLGKQIDLEMGGTEVELDKSILDALLDPLTHIIRNCCDHGIEPPAVRTAAGKAPAGRIVLRANHEGSQIRIEVRDDGRGMNPAMLKAKALEKGLKSAPELERMNEQETLALILVPGFSTAAAVTDISGRGVGLDVVKTILEQLSGTLEIESTPGRGSAFQLRLPLTLAIIPCLMVRVGSERYAIPQKSLEEVLFVPAGRLPAPIEWAHDREFYRLRQRLLPLVRLTEVMQYREPFTAATRQAILQKYQRGTDAPAALFIAVVRVGAERCGLIVDSILSTEEIVVKPLHGLVKTLACFSGATILGDGRAALILDVEGIARHAGAFQGGLAPSPADTAEEPPTDRHMALLFRCGEREQFAIPMSMIRRIVMIRPDQIEQVGDREWAAVEGVHVRVLRLERLLQVSPFQEQPVMYLVLPRHLNRPTGILVSSIIDTESLALEFSTDSSPIDGVLGSALVRGRLTLFLDVYRLADKADAGGPEERSRLPAVVEKKKLILLVEDTQFFRELVKRYLETVGYEVVMAVNGMAGLEQLQRADFDLIVSDIEMPVMDGWRFARAVREQNRDVPLLALTTRDSEADRQRAQECGFNRYELKLNRATLLAAVADLLRPQRLRLSDESRK